MDKVAFPQWASWLFTFNDAGCIIMNDVINSFCGIGYMNRLAKPQRAIGTATAMSQSLTKTMDWYGNIASGAPAQFTHVQYKFMVSQIELTLVAPSNISGGGVWFWGQATSEGNLSNSFNQVYCSDMSDKDRKKYVKHLRPGQTKTIRLVSDLRQNRPLVSSNQINMGLGGNQNRDEVLEIGDVNYAANDYPYFHNYQVALCATSLNVVQPQQVGGTTVAQQAAFSGTNEGYTIIFRSWHKLYTILSARENIRMHTNPP